MTTVVHKESLTPIYDARPNKYDPANWFIDPDLSALVDVPYEYWLESGGVFSEMTQPEKDAVDVAIAQRIEDKEKKQAKLEIDDERVLRAFAEVVMDEINILRGQHGLAARTLSQLVTAIKGKIDAAQ